MFAQFIDFDQEQRLKQDEAVEEIYLSGITDAADGRLPVMAEIIYLQGYCAGMKQVKMIDSSITAPQGKQTELPLVCGQCQHLNSGKCGIKGITRNGNQYACPSISVDCPF
ncbi:hypothetical protein [Nostoc sp.]|uniref:hypothetical protein n=1 Tax=Nostoc sp. TaxID=1180 RepID=UPI003594519D